MSWQAVVTTDDVNVRADASTASVVIETAAVGQQVTVTGALKASFCLSWSMAVRDGSLPITWGVSPSWRLQQVVKRIPS